MNQLRIFSAHIDLSEKTTLFPFAKQWNNFSWQLKKLCDIIIMKTVRFTEDTKQHDGLSPNLRLYDEVVHDYFNRPTNRYKTLNSLKKPLNKDNLANLRKNLLNLADRSNSTKKIPVLQGGGGRGNIVDKRFTKWILKLAEIYKK